MSSHHIVRDNQEPALLVWDASLTPFRAVEELLEWSPFVVVHESQVELFLLQGIKIDGIVLCESSEEKMIASVANQLPLIFIQQKTSGSLLLDTLSALEQRGHRDVNILMNNFIDQSLLEKADGFLSLSVVTPSTRWSLVRSGHFEKWLPDGSTIQVRTAQTEVLLTPDSKNKVEFKHADPFWIGERLAFDEVS